MNYDRELPSENAMRAAAITVRAAYERLGEILRDNPQAADWPLYSEGCDCTDPAKDFEIHADVSAEGSFVELKRVQYADVED